MDSYIGEGPIIKEIWLPASELSNHFVFEAWDSLMRSGIIAMLELDEVETYRFAIKKIREAIYNVREASSNWLRILAWDKAMEENKNVINQRFPSKIVLQQNVSSTRDVIKIAKEAIQKAIDLLNEKSYS